MKGFAGRLIDCKDYYCSISSEAKWLNSKKWTAGDLLFDYRRQITVTEQSGSGLTDYQILIELDSTNFDFSHANEDGSDIRFHDGNNLLNYWIEKWDSINQEAKIWVKVPSIPASSSTSFYMYYGNPNITSASNGEDTFEFFDDFEDDIIDTSKWTIISGTWEEVNGCLRYSNSLGEAYIRSSYSGTNYKVISKIALESTSKNANIFVRFSDTDNLYLLQWNVRNKWQLWKRVGGTWTELTEIELPQDTGWHIWKFTIYDNKLKAWLDDENEISATDTTFSSGYMGFRVGSSAPVYKIDWVGVCKYTDPEPSVSIGSEETL